MSVRDEVVRRLQSGGRIEEGVKEEPEADIANLRAAVSELQAIVVYLGEELDRRDSTRS
jgi:hypothetical protein